MNPRLFPIRLTGCVFDPRTVDRTQSVINEDGSVATSKHAWAWHQPNYKRLASERSEGFNRVWPQLFEAVLPPGMGEHGGVCLSITLPPAFSKPLRQDEPRSLPRIPDRWLWVRIVRRVGNGENAAPMVSAWIIDAGVKANDDASAPVLANENGKLSWCRVGVKRSLTEANRKPADELRESLHLQGTDSSADVTFAAFAPANMSNSSCVDRLDDVPPDELRQCAVSYFVVGWYRNPLRDDPLTQLHAEGKTKGEIAEALGIADDDLSILGDRCVFTGLLAHVDYWNERSYLGPAFGSPEAKPVHPCVGTFHHDPQKIGFGTTAEDALAALLAELSPEGEPQERLAADFQRLIKALLTDQLDTWDTSGGTDLQRQADHSSGFHPVSGGLEWRIGPAEESNAGGALRSAMFQAPRKPTADHWTLLDALNDLQARANVKCQEMASMTETLYAAWWLSLRARGRKKKALDALVTRLSTAAEDLRSEQARLLALANAQRHDLQKKLDDAFGNGAFAVQESLAPSFFLPKEPAIALRNVGPRIPPAPRQDVTRTLQDVAKEQVPGNLDSLAYAPIRAALRDYTEADLDAILAALGDEAALVERAVAALMRDEGKGAVFTKDSSVEQWEQRIRRVQSKAPNIEFTTSKGKRIALAELCSIWIKQPWVPLFLDWEVEWFPAGREEHAPSSAKLTGRTVLAHRPQDLIRSRLARLGKTSASVSKILQSCQHLLTAVMDWDVLAQSLSGIHQQLLLRDDLLPRLLPADEPLRGLLESTTLAPPNQAANLEFDNVRRGEMKITRSWVVDQFGQAFAVDAQVQTALATSNGADRIRLDPRLLEPTRLAVEFEVLQGARSPVRGWLLPNLADRALVVYDARGTPLGMISQHDDPGSTRWTPVRSSSPQSIDDLADPELAKFVREIVGAEEHWARFDDLFQLVNDALERTAPAFSMMNTSPASLLGRPLVLLRAEVRLERRGGAVIDPGKLADGITEMPAQTAPWTVPLWLGSRGLLDDGVIAYRVDADAPRWRRTAKLASDSPSLTLETAGPRASTEMTLIADPHGKIYLETDILPTTILTLKREWYEDAASKLPAVLRVAPALLGSAAQLASNTQEDSRHIDLPLPIGHAHRTEPNGAEPDAVVASSAIFSTLAGEFLVDAGAGPVRAPDDSVAAIEGILIF